MTFELHYNGKVNDHTGDQVRNYNDTLLVVTHQIYDISSNKTTLVLEKVDDLQPEA